ncbi:Transcriptional Regulator, LysR family protein [Vibrio coralliirubri]|uniref:LysR family transcriptional regulator n=1 Tax=Vibrio TaxID=662 RepID=UPI0006341B48|nr:LysR family transcriptional regulator [Vibrio coralliirubri]CDU04206.1 Transcriptional Regulator, LysR family protein [Vibrio coralliirubri]
MEIKVLKSFVAVATHCSFSKAAKELNTVQPAISRHITSLEHELGVSLFFRTSREVVISAAGQHLLKDAIKLIEQTEQAKQSAIRASSGCIGTLTIGYLGGATLSFLPRLVRQYIAENPNIDVDLVEMTASEQIEALDKREIDISFSRPLPNLLVDDYTSVTIYTDKLVAVLPVTHELAQHSTIQIKQLQQDPFILFEREQAVGLFDSIITQCDLSGFSPNIKKQPNNMQTVLTQVSSGLGVSIAPHAIRDLRSEGCVFVNLESVDVPMPLVMTHHSHTLSPTASVFVAVVQSEIEAIQQNMA